VLAAARKFSHWIITPWPALAEPCFGGSRAAYIAGTAKDQLKEIVADEARALSDHDRTSREIERGI
jgi:hypothetical protein